MVDNLKESNKGSEAREEAYKKEEEDLFGGVLKRIFSKNKVMPAKRLEKKERNIEIRAKAGY